MTTSTEVRNVKPGRKLHWLKIVAIAMACTAILVYGFLIGFYMHIEKRLVFAPSRVMRTVEPDLAPAEEQVVVRESNGIQIAAVELRSSVPSATWIYFLHGNEGNLSTCQEWFRALHRLNVNVVAIDYRGYGQSTGEPSENGLYSDALAGYQFLTTTLHINPAHIVIYGHSLGSDVAIELASTTQPAGLIVEGGLISIPERGQELIPFLPVKLIAHNRFDGASRISKVGCPILFFHAADDQMIPINHGRKLYELARPPKYFVETYGGHANAIVKDQPAMLGAIRSFLTSVTPDLGPRIANAAPNNATTSNE